MKNREWQWEKEQTKRTNLINKGFVKKQEDVDTIALDYEKGQEKEGF